MTAKKPDLDIRLDLVLTKRLSISRSQAQKMVREGLVAVNGNSVNSKYLVTKGDKITLSEAKKSVTPDIQIIFEDKDILVIDKPAGITVHPAPGESDITIAEIFSYKFTGKQVTDRDMIVHRLDKGTSGIMVLAKNVKAKESLTKQFAKRKVTKTYITLVHGRVTPNEGVIDMPLARDLIAKNRIAPADEGKDAKTIYKVAKYFKGFTLISATPKTGRTHQIRVHFAAIGHYLYGDERYGVKDVGAKRIFLHAAELSFIHPGNEKRVKFVSPLPSELSHVLAKLEAE